MTFNPPTTPRWAGFLTLTLVASFCLSAQARQQIDESREANADARIHFTAVTGNFDIVGHDDNSFRLEGQLGDDVEELIITGGPDDWRIELEPKDGNYNWRDSVSSSDLTLYVPVAAEVRAGVVSADLQVENLLGARVEVATVSGNIDLDNVLPERLDAKTVSGDLYVEGGGQSDSSLASVSGDVEATELRGRISVESVSGDVTIEAFDVSDLEAQSVSGDLVLNISPLDRATLDLSAHSGDIELVLPATTQMDLEANTFSGDLNNAFGGDVIERAGPGEEMMLIDGNGGVRIKAQTFSGELNIERQ